MQKLCKAKEETSDEEECVLNHRHEGPEEGTEQSDLDDFHVSIISC